ncbi:Nucleoside triphosphatase NudI [bacterium HR34]|nr:Nucleoside triphosphatase NudI [bacterium HR34]
MKKIVQKIVLGGVIVNKEGKILILQRSPEEEIFPNMWELPSGKREPLENSEKCLLREIKEETGLEVKIIMPFSVFDYQIQKKDEVRDTTQINFLLKTNGNKIVKLSSEHQNFTWISKKEINRYKLSEKTKKVILKAFKLIDLIEKSNAKT